MSIANEICNFVEHGSGVTYGTRHAGEAIDGFAVAQSRFYISTASIPRQGLGLLNSYSMSSVNFSSFIAKNRFSEISVHVIQNNTIWIKLVLIYGQSTKWDMMYSL